MATERWREIKRLFGELHERPESERAALLAACDDVDVRASVAALLAAERDAREFLAEPTGPTSTTGLEDSGALFDQLQRALAGRFSLEREIGRGGMGIVYLARDVALDRPVAIKRLPPSLTSDPGARERFVREARTAAGLSHPNIVPIHLVEASGDLVYFVMAYVQGESLGERVRRTGPLKPPEVGRLVQEVAWALGYAHGRGIIHRDVKPDNILMERGTGRALVTDFGIARVASGAVTGPAGEMFGTAAYMSPEQGSPDAAVDGRADLYSLGVTAFFALTGRLPFEAPSPLALRSLHLGEPAPPVRSVTAMVPARLAEAVDRCLAKDPGARFQSGEALAEAIADARVTRAEIAPSLRDFLGSMKSSAAQIGLLGVAWMGLGLSGVVENSFGGMALVIMLGLVSPLVLIHPLLAARGLVRAGMDEEDVAAAAAASSTMRDANIEYELARANRLAHWFSKPWARGIFLAAALGGLAVVFGSDVIPDLIRAGFGLRGLAIATYLGLMVPFEAFFVGMAVAPKRTVATLTRGTPEYAGFLKRLWRGPLGRWFFQLAGWGLARRAALPPPDAAPTEVLLGRAAHELFDRLSDLQRARLGDVPELIRRLERAALALRERRDELDQALANAGARDGLAHRGEVIAELEASRVAIAERLGGAVAALENLRLDLLRLRAGVGSPDDLTDSIQEARSVGDRVVEELVAHREVESLGSGAATPI